MAMKLSIDTGIKEFEVNGKEILRFNPSDPNVYNRFFEAAETISKLEDDYMQAQQKAAGEMDENGFPCGGKKVIEIMRDVDGKVKEQLSYVFGEENNFNKILGGINIMAVGSNGERIVTNLLAALHPIIMDGMQQHTKEKANAAVNAAAQNRAQRRAQGKT